MKCPLSKEESLVVVYIIPSKHPLSKCGCPMVCIITFHNRSHPCANPQEQLLQRYYNNTVLCSDHHPPAQSMLQALFPSIVSVGETLCNSVLVLYNKSVSCFRPNTYNIICPSSAGNIKSEDLLPKYDLPKSPGLPCLPGCGHTHCVLAPLPQPYSSSLHQKFTGSTEQGAVWRTRYTWPHCSAVKLSLVPGLSRLQLIIACSLRRPRNEASQTCAQLK